MHKVCKTCKGKGHSRATRPTVEVIGKTFTTKEIGSGCPECLGLGIKGERHVYASDGDVARPSRAHDTRD